ncbi:DNA helicase UvrD [Candidatus Woesearchaeota archaeon]|nr:DNA helicase UvrD [Candidatus Woesearchaeota archaeon]
MRIIVDLHIHSKYSRGCSKELDLKNLEKWAKIKGVQLLGTGDFLHPQWIQELKRDLKEDDTGILKTKTGFPFVLQTEVSLIYTQDGKGYRMHMVILAPSFEVVDKLIGYFTSHGRVDYDGRPIFKIPAPQLVRELKEISDDIEIIPAHIWTPWFSLFGSKSGFDSMTDAFKDQKKHIYALETGLSSDPEMNWQWSELDNYQLVSFSDLHSYWPWRIGREATVFDIELTYKNLLKAIRTGEGLVETIEVNPNYGKYHYDGHRNCAVSFSPKQTRQHNKICPVCKKSLTIGVEYRVEELKDRDDEKPKNKKPFKHLIPLHEIISKYLGAGINTKKVWDTYNKLIAKFDNEFNILLNVKKDELQKVISEKLTDYILRNRKGEIKVIPGYDGEYGIPVFEEKDKPATEKPKMKTSPQKGLSDFF